MTKTMWVTIIIMVLVRYAAAVGVALLLLITFDLEYNVFLVALVINLAANFIQVQMPKRKKTINEKWSDWGEF